MPDQTSNWHIATWTVGLNGLPLLSGGAHIEIVAAVTVVMLCTTLVGIRVHRGSLQLPKAPVLLVSTLLFLTLAGFRYRLVFSKPYFPRQSTPSIWPIEDWRSQALHHGR